ncbi:class F sortase, partial [Streptomyces aureus]
MAPRRRRRPWYRTRAYRLTRTLAVTVALVVGGVWWAGDDEPSGTVAAGAAHDDGAASRAPATA